MDLPWREYSSLYSENACITSLKVSGETATGFGDGAQEIMRTATNETMIFFMVLNANSTLDDNFFIDLCSSAESISAGEL